MTEEESDKKKVTREEMPPLDDYFDPNWKSFLEKLKRGERKESDQEKIEKARRLPVW